MKNKINPKDHFIQNKTRSGMSRFYDGLSKINLHVEDRNKKCIYEALFEKLDMDITIIDTYDGKISVIKEAFKEINEENLRSQNIYILDRDYSYKNPDKTKEELANYSFNQLKTKSNIKILEKHSIENYLFSIEGIKQMLKIKSISRNELLKLNIEQLSHNILETSRQISQLFCFNNVNELGLKQDLNIVYSFELFCYKTQEVKQYINNLKSKSNYNNLTFCKEFKRVRLSFTDEDIKIKDHLKILLKKISSEIKKDLKKQIKLNLDEAVMFCIESLPEHSKTEIKKIF